MGSNILQDAKIRVPPEMFVVLSDAFVTPCLYPTGDMQDRCEHKPGSLLLQELPDSFENFTLSCQFGTISFLCNRRFQRRHAELGDPCSRQQL